MIRRTAKYLVIAGMISFASFGHAGTGSVTPALAACSKALIATLTTDATPTYTVKPATNFISDLVDPNAFTVVAKSTRTNALLAKASCKATSTGEIVSFKSIPLKS
jgi:Flp pilus assembly protein TadG